VARFLGAQPESRVRAFIDALLPSSSELARLEGGEASLREALALDPANDVARLDLAELLVEEGKSDEAERLLAEVQDNTALNARRDALRAAAGFARGGESEQALRSRLAGDPDDLEARYALAQRHAAARGYREAMDELLAIVRKDKNWRDGEARKQLLALFTLAAADQDLVTEFRRKLATALY
jgi:putative thioredoxin